MNPVTQGLLKQLNDPDSTRFAESWDQLEQLVIEIYKQKSVSFDQQTEFFAVREKLQTMYPKFSQELDRFWPHIKVKGELMIGNPLASILSKQGAKEFVENWDAMRTLPAAREALNQMLVARIESNADRRLKPRKQP